ncbi:MAG: TonB-dependent receptor, partial [Burkholderiales bacterium]|nr:TonB-dependent receptor [Burkholderiales bacterium]
MELSGRVGSQTGLYGTLAWTWLPTAEQESAFRRADTNALIQQSAAGKRMPYAPKHTTTAGIGYMHPSGLDMNVEAVYVSDQFSDFTNTENPSADGQFGRIPSFTVYNAAVNYRLTQYKLTLYVAV